MCLTNFKRSLLNILRAWKLNISDSKNKFQYNFNVCISKLVLAKNLYYSFAVSSKLILGTMLDGNIKIRGYAGYQLHFPPKTRFGDPKFHLQQDAGILREIQGSLATPIQE